MPEATFDVRWPDGTVERCWSPSLVVWDHLAPGTDYPLAAFTAAASAALEEAAERVRARYGFACTSAMEQRDAILARAAGFAQADRVRVLTIAPPLPVTA